MRPRITISADAGGGSNIPASTASSTPASLPRLLPIGSLAVDDLTVDWRNTVTGLSVGRRLNDQVRLILSQNLRESELAWIVDYLPRDNLEVRGIFSGQNERAYDFRHALGALRRQLRVRRVADWNRPPLMVDLIPRLTCVCESARPVRA